MSGVGNLMRRATVIDGCFAVALAAFVLVVHHGMLNQIGWLDPWIYTGFTFNLPDLAERFGPTYYSLRMAHILPSAAFHALLGPVAGYMAFKFLLVALLFFCLVQVARGFFEPRLARLLAGAFVLHPWTLRSLSWDYCDGTGVVYLAIVLAFLNLAVRDERERNGAFVCAGAALAFAANSNLFILTVGAVLFLWPVTRMVVAGQWGRIFRAAGFSAAGFIAGYFALILSRRLAVPDQGWVFDIFGISTGAQMAAGGGEVWHEDVVQLILHENRWYLLAPVFVLALLAGAWLGAGRESRKSAVFGAGLVLAVTVAGYCAADFGFKVAVISLPFYFVYLTPAMFLGVCATLALVGKSRNVAPAAAAVAWGILLCGAAVDLMLSRFSESAPASGWVSLTLVAAGVAWLFTAGRGVAGEWAGVCVAVVAVASQIPFFAGHVFYRPIDAQSAKREWDVYRIGQQLFESFSELPRERTELAFWYPSGWKDGVPTDLDGLNSMWLWSRSRVQGPESTAAIGMPELAADDETRLRKYRNIVLLSWDQEDVDRGSEVVRNRVGIASSRAKDFESGPLVLHTEMITIPDQKEYRRKLRQEQRKLRKEEATELVPG